MITINPNSPKAKMRKISKMLNFESSSTFQQNRKKRESKTLNSKMSMSSSFNLQRHQNFFKLVLEGKVPLNDSILIREKDNFTKSQKLEILIMILLKNSIIRTEEEINFIDEYLNNSNYLSEIKQEIPFESYSKLIKDFTYEFAPRGKTLFSYGQKGRKYYFILKGSVYVLIPLIGMGKNEIYFTLDGKEIPIFEEQSIENIAKRISVSNIKVNL